MVNDHKIERLNSLGSSQKGLKFLSIKTSSDNVTVSNVSFATAGAASSSNYSANWGGFKRLISVDALIYDDGTDKSTEGSNVVTLLEQRQHLLQPDGVIQGVASGESQSDNSYRVTLDINGVQEVITGTIEDITVTGDVTESTLLRCTFNLFEAQ